MISESGRIQVRQGRRGSAVVSPYVTNGTISIGDGGDASLTVSNGSVLAQNIRLGSNPNAQSSLTFAGGVGIISSGIVIGDCNAGGSGVLTMNGGDVFVINTTHNATVDFCHGQPIVDGGFLWIDRLVMTNSVACLFATAVRSLSGTWSSIQIWMLMAMDCRMGGNRATDSTP